MLIKFEKLLEENQKKNFFFPFFEFMKILILKKRYNTQSKTKLLPFKLS